jgi:hypothetical protein
MLQSCHRNAGQNHNAKITTGSFENLEKLKHLGKTETNKNFILEEIKRRLNCGNACYHSFQSLLSSRLLSKNAKIIIYKTVFLPVVWYGCQNWSQALMEEHRLRVFESRVLRIFGSKRDEVIGG